MKARNVVVVLTGALVFYMVLIGVRGIELLDNPRWAARGLGLGVVLLPVVGTVLVVRELRFGYATERLGRALGPEPGDPPDPAVSTGTALDQTAGRPALGDGRDRDDPTGDDDLGVARRTPSGRIDKEYADAVFQVRKAQVEVAPSDWRTWYRLAIAYSDARDTTRARRAMRHAIAVERGDLTATPPGRPHPPKHGQPGLGLASPDPASPDPASPDPASPGPGSPGPGPSSLSRDLESPGGQSPRDARSA